MKKISRKFSIQFLANIPLDDARMRKDINRLVQAVNSFASKMY